MYFWLDACMMSFGIKGDFYFFLLRKLNINPKGGWDPPPTIPPKGSLSSWEQSPYNPITDTTQKARLKAFPAPFSPKWKSLLRKLFVQAKQYIVSLWWDIT